MTSGPDLESAARAAFAVAAIFARAEAHGRDVLPSEVFRLIDLHGMEAVKRGLRVGREIAADRSASVHTVALITLLMESQS